MQAILPYKIQEEKELKLTSHAGLPLIHEAFHQLKLPKLIRKHLKLKQKGWKEADLIEVLMAIAAMGGCHMEDVAILQKDEAYLRLLNKKKGLPSVKSIERFLKKFHLEQKKPEGVDAWVPVESKALQSLSCIHQEITRELIRKSGLKVVTIENDATIIFSHKEQAQGTYKGGTGYAPVIGNIAELGLILHDEFRDGNVPASFQVKEFFQKCEKALPETVEKIRARFDGAYYNLEELIPYFQSKKIEFTITGKKSKSILAWIEALDEKAWKPLRKMTDRGWVLTGREWTELVWVSANGTRETMEKRTLRYLVTRKTEQQWELFQEEFNSEVTKKDRYEVIATNMDWEGNRLILWHYERGGSIEYLHDRIKNDLAGGVLPCAEFGANAAWFRIECLTWNLLRALQLHALPEQFQNCHLKKLRLWLFNLAGKVVDHGRQLFLKLKQGDPI